MWKYLGVFEMLYVLSCSVYIYFIVFGYLYFIKRIVGVVILVLIRFNCVNWESDYFFELVFIFVEWEC